MKIAQRYDCIVWGDHDGNVHVKLICMICDIDNPRCPDPFAETSFRLAGRHINVDRVRQHMDTLTDDQCDSFYQQERVKRSKKSKAGE